MKIKRIALIGLGAMGVFFAPRLYEAFGDDFYIIAGGERKKRLESKGVTINGVNYRFPHCLHHLAKTGSMYVHLPDGGYLLLPAQIHSPLHRSGR